MSWSGIELFASNSGQTTHTHDPASSDCTMTFGANPFMSNGAAFYSSGYWAVTGAGDPSGSDYVEITWKGSTYPGGQTYTNLEVGFVHDGGNVLIADFNTNGPVGTTQIQILIIISGTHNPLNVTTYSAVAGVRVALSLVGNIAKVWIYDQTTGVWNNILTNDISAYHDFTAVGGKTGWRPAVGMSASPNASTVSFSTLQWGPFADLQTINFFPPTGLIASAIPGPAVGLSWIASVPFPGNPLTQPARYNIYRDGVYLNSVTTAGVTSYIDSTIVSGNTYSYTVAAANGTNVAVSAQSVPVTIGTAPVFLTMPFAQAATYKPIMLANVEGIKPRIYVPIQSTTVSTKQ